MANYGFKMYTNSFLGTGYNLGYYSLPNGSISVSTPHKFSNASTYTGTPLAYVSSIYYYGNESASGSDNPRGQTLRIGYNNDGRQLKFWSLTAASPGSGSSAPTATELSPTSVTQDSELGYIYEITWPSGANAFMITENDKYGKPYSYNNIDRTKITLEEFISRWDYYPITTSGKINYRTSSAWATSASNLKNVYRWNGSTWKSS